MVHVAAYAGYHGLGGGWAGGLEQESRDLPLDISDLAEHARAVKSCSITRGAGDDLDRRFRRDLAELVGRGRLVALMAIQHAADVCPLDLA